MEKRNRPIGFFDSGVGGLSVLRQAIRELPNENFLFYGDCANVPYGEKSPEEVKQLTMSCCDLLYKKGAKALLIACNTATSAAIHAMREKYQMPVISMEPAIKPANESAKPGKVLVMPRRGRWRATAMRDWWRGSGVQKGSSMCRAVGWRTCWKRAIFKARRWTPTFVGSSLPLPGRRFPAS